MPECLPSMICGTTCSMSLSSSRVSWKARISAISSSVIWFYAALLSTTLTSVTLCWPNLRSLTLRSPRSSKRPAKTNFSKLIVKWVGQRAIFLMVIEWANLVSPICLASRSPNKSKHHLNSPNPSQLNSSRSPSRAASWLTMLTSVSLCELTPNPMTNCACCEHRKIQANRSADPCKYPTRESDSSVCLSAVTVKLHKFTKNKAPARSLFPKNHRRTGVTFVHWRVRDQSSACFQIINSH